MRSFRVRQLAAAFLTASLLAGIWKLRTTRQRQSAWGAVNAHLESWGPFGRGWSLKRFSAQVIEPQCIPLIGFPKAWSPGTDRPFQLSFK
ncbi:MAG: hypothetical protein ACLQVG_10370, partial [Terriglobia bacterium]